MGGDPGRLPSLEELVAKTLEAARIKSSIEEWHRLRELDNASEATAPVRAAIAAEALKHRGSEVWRKDALRVYEGPDGSDYYGPGDNKCNLFVYEMLTQAGARVEMELRTNVVGVQIGYPPLAAHWADPQHAIPGFSVLKVPPDTPQPGDVAAIKNVSWSASGHVGIVVGSSDGSATTTVSGRFDGVVHNDWGFRDENKDEVVFRRYVGWPEVKGSPQDTGIRTTAVAYETVPPVPDRPREPNKCGARVRGGVK